MMFLQVQSLLLLHPQPFCHMQLPFQVTQHEVLMGCRKNYQGFPRRSTLVLPVCVQAEAALHVYSNQHQAKPAASPIAQHSFGDLHVQTH